MILLHKGPNADLHFETRSQSYIRNFVLEKAKSVLNYLTVHYCNLVYYNKVV